MSHSTGKDNNVRISETPEEYAGLHRILMYVAGFFFIYLILESAILIPTLFLRYGLH